MTLSSHFKTDNTYLYTLHLSIGAGVLAYCVLNEEQTVIVVKSYHLSSEEEALSLLKSDLVLGYSYRQVKVAFQSMKFTPVPEAFFALSETEIYLRPIAPVSPDEQVEYDYLPALNMYMVYAIKKKLLESILQHFGRAVVFHSLTPLLLYAQRLPDLHLGANLLIVNTTNRLQQIAVFDRTKLLFVNQFEYKTAKDFLYYVLLVCDRLHLSPHRVQVGICGDITTEAETYKELYKYLQQLLSLPQPQFVKYADGIIHGTQFYDLFSLQLCEL